jgi:hypothetical protein
LLRSSSAKRRAESPIAWPGRASQPMRVLIYKRTRQFDPNDDGVFG